MFFTLCPDDSKSQKIIPEKPPHPFQEMLAHLKTVQFVWHFWGEMQNVKYKISTATILSHNPNSLLPAHQMQNIPTGTCAAIQCGFSCFYWRLWHFPQNILKLLWHTKEMLSCHVWQMWQPVFCCKNRSILINRLGMAMGHQTRLNHMVPVDCWDTSWSIFEVKRHSYKMPKLVHT